MREKKKKKEKKEGLLVAVNDIQHYLIVSNDSVYDLIPQQYGIAK
jgi:hypothetical protein